MSIIQITKLDTVFSGIEKDLKEMQDKFNKHHFIKLSNFLEPELLHCIQEGIEKAGFNEGRYMVEDGYAADYRLKDKSMDNLLRFLINDENLFQLIQKITNCSKIGSFNGETYRMNPDKNHYDNWHTDNWDNRMISISINLSTDIYSGGILQIRDISSKEIVHEVANIGFGDCIIFRVSPKLEHRVTNVEGKFSKTAFPGWFKSKPNYRSFFEKETVQFKKSTTTTKLTSFEHSAIVANKEFYTRNFKENFLIFNPSNAKCYSLNSIGEKVFNLIQDPISIKEIEDHIQNEYEIDREQCKQDILDLLQDLATNNLINVLNKETRLVTSSPSVTKT